MSLTPTVNMPPVSTTPVVKSQAIVVDTGGAFLDAIIFAIFRKNSTNEIIREPEEDD
jgi:hypothetical protein